MKSPQAALFSCKLLILAMILSGCSSHPQPLTAITKATQLGPGKMHEHCVRGVAGHQYSYQFQANQSLAFNVHYHIGNNRHYLVEQESSQEASDFTIDRPFHHCLMWTNQQGDTVMLDYSIKQLN